MNKANLMNIFVLKNIYLQICANIHKDENVTYFYLLSNAVTLLRKIVHVICYITII